MAITVVGVKGSVDTLEWAQLFQDVAACPGGLEGSFVPLGMAGSAKAGAVRVSTTGAGRTLQAGTNLLNTTAFDVPHTANTSGSPRIDTVVAEVVWLDAAGTALTETTAGSVRAVAGVAAANPAPPRLTQSTGSRWQTPLYHVRVVNGKADAFTAADITDARPTLAADRSRPFVALNVPGNFTSPGTPLGVERDGDLVEFSGRLTRTVSNIVAGGQTDFGNVALIPAGYRPKRQHQSIGYGATGGNALLKLVVNPDGTMLLVVLAGTLAANETFFVTTTTWIGA